VHLLLAGSPPLVVVNAICNFHTTKEKYYAFIIIVVSRCTNSSHYFDCHPSLIEEFGSIKKALFKSIQTADNPLAKRWGFSFDGTTSSVTAAMLGAIACQNMKKIALLLARFVIR
jgi:hypothetical protein